MRLAYTNISMLSTREGLVRFTHIFDVRAWVNSDDITMLDSEVMSNNTVHAGAPIIQIVIGKHNQDRVLALLSLHQHGIATEQL
jgi:hypothetical protein